MTPTEQTLAIIAMGVAVISVLRLMHLFFGSHVPEDPTKEDD